MASRDERIAALRELLRERILVVDGAMGTAIQARGITAADFGGPELEGCNENLARTRPDVIVDIHRGYLEAGADILETDTFGGTRIVLSEYGLQDHVHEINAAAARLARKAADEYAAPGAPRFVAGSVGPTTKAISVTGGVTFPELVAAFREQALGLLDGGVDVLLVETAQDTRNVKAALIGIGEACEAFGTQVPIMVSGTIEQTGTMLAGQNTEAFAASLSHAGLLSLGLNCATGPTFMTDHIRTLAALTSFYVSCIPNAGLPDENGRYLETPEMLARALERFVDEGWVNVLGGCCGTTPQHIRAIARMVRGRRPRVPAAVRRSVYSGIEVVEATDDTRPLLVGERTNVIGSRLFKQLIVEDRFEEASEIARRQVRGGAHIVDVCLQDPDRDEVRDIERFYDHLIRKVKVPIMIDSTDPPVIEVALTYCQGKAIINSINLEDGEERFASVTPLARKCGAAVVVGCIDEDTRQAQAITRQRKLEVARRSYDLLTTKYGIPPEDIIFDPLVFPCATGDKNYVGSAVETIEGIRLIKAALPGSRTILGISNISFGLPPRGREVLNAVFLYHCTKAGLDLAIVNAEKLERYAGISEEERRLAEDLLWNRGEDPIAAFAAHFRGAAAAKPRRSDLPLDARLSNYIVEGSKDGLIEDLERKRQEASPLEIINGPLLAGMDEVGRLFNNNEMIVAEVLQSAEAMKAAVSYLEQFMEKADVQNRGTVILATVKGDVHDIGKNLVEIIFANNGYRVLNLGIKVPPAALIEAYHRHAPDAIGLSGLLVKSAQQMVVTATDLRAAGITVPLLVGGAALSDRFTRSQIAPAYGELVCYAKDAMTGLALIHRVMDPEARPALLAERLAPLPEAVRPEEGALAVETEPRSPAVAFNVPIPPAPDLDLHIEEVANLDLIWGYVNPQMLYGKHLGFKGNFEALLGQDDPKAARLWEDVERVKAECRAALMRVRVIWRFLEAEGQGNAIHLFEGRGSKTLVHTFRFPRQRRAGGLCLSDLVLPPRDGRRYHIALFVTGAGEGIREEAERAKVRGEYFRSFALQALALETAEAAAEWLHRRLRELWGFPDPPQTTMPDRFRARYRGKRYSFGYPACPNLEDQAGLFELLRPEGIGVSLTEGFMMEPEASVSALVFHHPDARYFTAP